MWTGYFLIARLLRSYPISNPRPLSNSNNPINHEDSDCTDEIKTSLPSVPNVETSDDGGATAEPSFAASFGWAISWPLLLNQSLQLVQVPPARLVSAVDTTV